MNSNSKLGQYRHKIKGMSQSEVLAGTRMDGYMNVSISKQESGKQPFYLEDAMSYCNACSMTLDEIAAILHPDKPYNTHKGLYSSQMGKLKEREAVLKITGGQKEEGQDNAKITEDINDATAEQTEPVLLQNEEDPLSDMDDKEGTPTDETLSNITTETQDSNTGTMPTKEIRASKIRSRSHKEGRSCILLGMAAGYNDVKLEILKSLIGSSDGIIASSETMFDDPIAVNRIRAEAYKNGYTVYEIDLSGGWTGFSVTTMPVNWRQGLLQKNRAFDYLADAIISQRERALENMVRNDTSLDDLSCDMYRSLLMKLLSGEIEYSDSDAMQEYLNKEYKDRADDQKVKKLAYLITYNLLLYAPMLRQEQTGPCMDDIISTRHLIILNGHKVENYPDSAAILIARYAAAVYGAYDYNIARNKAYDVFMDIPHGTKTSRELQDKMLNGRADIMDGQNYITATVCTQSLLTLNHSECRRHVTIPDMINTNDPEIICMGGVAGKTISNDRFIEKLIQEGSMLKLPPVEKDTSTDKNIIKKIRDMLKKKPAPVIRYEQLRPGIPYMHCVMENKREERGEIYKIVV